MKRLKIFLSIIILGVCAVLTTWCYAYDIVQVTNTPYADENSYSIAIFENTVYAVWVAESRGWVNSPRGAELYFDKSIDLGKTWGTYRKVIATGQDLLTLQPLTPKMHITQNGKIFILYGFPSFGSGRYHRPISLVVSEDGGENFFNGGQIPFPFGASNGFHFAIDETESVAYVVGITDMPSLDYYKGVFICKSFDGGRTFSETKELFLVWLGNDITVETTNNGEDVYIFLTQRGGPEGYRHIICFTKSSDYGETFSELKGVFFSFSYRLDSEIDDKGKIYLNFLFHPYDWSRRPWSVVLFETTDFGENFFSSEISDDYDWFSPNPRVGEPIESSISVDSLGNVYSAFYKIYQVDPSLLYGLYFDKRIGAGEFGADEYVAGPITPSYSKPTIAITPDGKTAFIMWNNSLVEGGDLDLYCTTFATDPIEVGGPNPDYTTIQEAIDNSQPGDTVYVHPGEYHENLILKDGVSLEGSGKDQLTVYGTIKVGSNCTLENLTFTYEIPNTSSYILLKIASSNVIVKDCSFNLSYNGTASMSYGNFLAYLKGNNITLEANNFNFTSSSSYYTRGIYAYACSNITLRKNRLTLKDNSIQRGYYIYGFQSVNSKNITLENNIIDARGNNARGIYGILSTSYNAAFDNAIVKNNTIFLRSNYPYKPYLTGIYTYQLAHLNIRNNIIDLGTPSSYYSKPCSITYYAPSTDTDTNTSTSTSTNTDTDTDTDTDTNTDIKVTYNIYDGAYTFIYKYPYDLAIIQHDNIKANPIFVNADQGDFHLWTTSPAIDKGDPKDPYYLESEPNGGRIDCGAYGNNAD